MNPDSGDALDEQLSDLLAAYDEAVAAGRTPDPSPEASAPPELRWRLRRARDCLRLLERARHQETVPELRERTRQPETVPESADPGG
jgi:hypothetical protein